MSRYRPPAPRSSPYMTRKGAQAMRRELQHLWRVERPEVTAALTAAAAEGDRSENAEYIYRKKQLAGIDRRIRYLSKRLEIVKVVDRPPADTARVFFGAWVTAEDDSGTRYRYRIVGADETDAERGWISVDSPVAKALLGKRAGDRVAVALPGGVQVFNISDIRYQE